VFFRTLVVALLCAVFANSQTKPADSAALSIVESSCNSADDVALRQIPEHWKNAYNGKDAAAVVALYSADAYYLTQHFAPGIVHPRTEIQAYVQLGVDAGYRIDSIHMLALDCSSDLAYAITQYHATNGAEKVMGINLVVLRKVGDKWVIVAHEAAVPDPATAIQSLRPAGGEKERR